MKLLKIGALQDRSISWEGKFGLRWTNEFEVLGITYNTMRVGGLTEIDICKIIKEIKNRIAVWRQRKLTPYGKVVIIKRLLFSKFTHELLALPSPNPQTFVDLNNIIEFFYEMTDSNFIIQRFLIWLLSSDG